MLNKSWFFAAIFVVQAACAVFFLYRFFVGLLGIPTAPIPWTFYELIEIGAALGLVIGTILSALMMRTAMHRTRRAEAALRLASGAFMDLVEERFDEWGLTPAEKDVALFALKGLSISEIAELRDTSAGTVKAQTNAIYRKAGVSGRPQLLSLFVEDLLVDPGVPEAS